MIWRRASARAVLCAGLSLPLAAFYQSYHRDLIEQAFQDVPEAVVYADPGSAVKVSGWADDAANSEPDQYMHSMRPAKTRLATAQRRASDYQAFHMDQAVKAALECDALEAGRHLGLVLHLVEDRKHVWCSCGPQSNGADSADSCSTSPDGCGQPGKGNHALPQCDWKRALAHPAALKDNFQIRTDGMFPPLGKPGLNQLRLAQQASDQVLVEFVRRVKAAGGGCR